MCSMRHALLSAAALGGATLLPHVEAATTAGLARVTASDDASLLGLTLQGVTQSNWMLGRAEWRVEGVPVKVLRDDDWCELGKRLKAFVEAGGSQYEYVDEEFARRYSGKLALLVDDGGQRPMCGPALTLLSSSTELYWPKVMICLYAKGLLTLRPSQDHNGWYSEWHSLHSGLARGAALRCPPDSHSSVCFTANFQGGQWWAEYTVRLILARDCAAVTCGVCSPAG
jgi:hypothetical protein